MGRWGPKAREERGTGCERHLGSDIMGRVHAREGGVWDDSDFEPDLLATWWHEAEEGNLRERDFLIDIFF